MSVSPADNSNNPLVSLPDEDKVHICSNLSGVDLTQLARTCNAFARVSREESFWKAETERTFTATHNPKTDNWKQEYLSLTKAALKGTVRIGIPQELANNKTFMLQAVKQKGYALRYASDELRNDRDIVLEAVKQNGHVLRDASDELRNDRDIVLEAVKQRGRALQYASDELRNNGDIVLEAVKQNCHALRDASDELQNDRDIVREAEKSKRRDRRFLLVELDTCQVS